MIRTKYFLYFLILILLFSSCARQRHRVTFQSPFQGREQETWGYPLPETSLQITSPFGEIRKKRNLSYWHQGIDIKARKGTPVLAVQKGIVTFAGKSKNYGLLVCIEHSGLWESRYAHLNTIEVKKNKKVKKGEVIGRVGETGNATGPHLHFELRKNGVPVNPASLLPIKY
ncbi:MAG: M23 family metallopeptidase [Candidatus Hydrogenedens sp.]